MARTMATSTIYEKKNDFLTFTRLKTLLWSTFERMCYIHLFCIEISWYSSSPTQRDHHTQSVTQKYPPDILYFTIVTCFLFKTKNRNCDISKFREVSVHLFCIEISWYSSFPSQRDHHTQCLDKNIHLK